MSKRKIEWCVWGSDPSSEHGCMLCKRCGGKEAFIVPADFDAFIMRMQAFRLDHKHCQPSEQGATDAK